MSAIEQRTQELTSWAIKQVADLVAAEEDTMKAVQKVVGQAADVAARGIANEAANEAAVESYNEVYEWAYVHVCCEINRHFEEKGDQETS